MNYPTFGKTYIVDTILARIAKDREHIQAQWNAPIGTNTKHLVIDNLLSNEDCHKIYSAFPRDGNGFFSRDSFREKKKTSANLSEFNKILSNITYAIQDKKVIELIGKITAIDNLEPDPFLYAGGLSMMFKDDFLNPHIDNSHDANRNRYRRLNLLYYVSPKWQIEFGGNLELWNKKNEVAKTIISKFNRLVIMETDKNSWHSVSKVVVKMPRCCVSNYFFSKDSPNQSKYFHVTSFKGRPKEISKRILSTIDNYNRNIFSRLLKIGRGKNLMNKNKK